MALRGRYRFTCGGVIEFSILMALRGRYRLMGGGVMECTLCNSPVPRVGSHDPLGSLQ